MDNLTININLQETIYVIGGTTVIAAHCKSNSTLFIKEGWPTKVIIEEFPQLKFAENIVTVGHFGMEAWSFQKDASIGLSDFPTV